MSDYILKEQGTKKDALADVSTEYILEMQNIRKEFLGGKIVANDDITLKIKTGEIHANLPSNFFEQGVDWASY